ncbi:unnamed protein product, partial [Protopolystoma xenopodis]
MRTHFVVGRRSEFICSSDYPTLEGDRNFAHILKEDLERADDSPMTPSEQPSSVFSSSQDDPFREEAEDAAARDDDLPADDDDMTDAEIEADLEAIEAAGEVLHTSTPKVSGAGNDQLVFAPDAEEVGVAERQSNSPGNSASITPRPRSPETGLAQPRRKIGVGLASLQPHPPQAMAVGDQSTEAILTEAARRLEAQAKLMAKSGSAGGGHGHHRHGQSHNRRLISFKQGDPEQIPNAMFEHEEVENGSGEVIRSGSITSLPARRRPSEAPEEAEERFDEKPDSEFESARGPAQSSPPPPLSPPPGRAVGHCEMARPRSPASTSLGQT